MAVSGEAIERIGDLFEGVGPVTTRRMFGGVGIYSEGRIFAVMLSDGELKLKGAGEMAATFERAGWVRWTYARAGSEKATAMPYWSLPDTLLDDPEAASDWARRALAAL